MSETLTTDADDLQAESWDQGPLVTRPRLGRPSKYDPKLAAKMLHLLSQGYSVTAAAGELDLHVDTVYQWAKDPEKRDFSDALKLGVAKRVHKLEADLLAAESSPKVVSRIFALKNAAPHEWRDKREVDHTSSDGSMSGPSLDTQSVAKALLSLLSKSGE